MLSGVASPRVHGGVTLHCGESALARPFIHEAHGAFWVVDLTKAINIVARLYFFYRPDGIFHIVDKTASSSANYGVYTHVNDCCYVLFMLVSLPRVAVRPARGGNST